jgi:polyisoprenoid-binding protein YceI
MVLVVIAVGAVAYSFLKPPEEASGPIKAIPVEVRQNAVEAEQSTSAESVQASAHDEPEATQMPMVEVDGSDAEFGVSSDPVIFEIVPADSEVRFIIEEELVSGPKTVVGKTDQVAGEIAIYVDEPSRTKIGKILVNARTLVTDNDFRNRAIKNQILSTNDYEFIIFEPTEIAGMPDSVSIGQSFPFQIIGDLTVRDVTNRLTFDATITPISESQLEGIASVTVLYSDFDLTIPQARSVASVEDEVILEIEFSAVAN